MEFTWEKHTLTPPRDRFNLLDLDENELYLKSIRVVMNDLNTEEFVHGNLHLNSRSIIFDPENEALPLIKIRYNSHFEFECISHEQIQSLYDSINTNKSGVSNAERSGSLHRKSVDAKMTKVSPRKKDSGTIYTKKGKHSVQGKSIFI